MKIDLTYTIYKPILSRAVRATITGRNRDHDNPAAGRFTRREINNLLDRTWENYSAIADKIPAEKTTGARMNVRLAALTYALFQALLSTGVGREYAMSLVTDAAWHVYAKWASIPMLLSRLLPGKPLIESCVRLFIHFPFNPPGYVSHIQAENGIVQTDFYRCPVALFMQQLDAADFCLHTWCVLDYPLAEKWGGRYSRPHTLAAGDNLCDMEWRTNRATEN